jgi:hypothetical protein
MRIHGRLVVATLVVLGVAAPEAGATLRTVNHIDPAGDPTVISYRIEGAPAFVTPIDFQLTDGDYRSFGPKGGTYTVSAMLPQGWQVADIQCVSSSGVNDFAIDIPNGRVTVPHGEGEHDTCTFTNRRIPASGPSAPSPGISPAPPRSEVPGSVLPRRPALVGVVAGRRFAEATVRITRESIINGRLQSKRGRIVGSARIQRKPGTHVLRVKLKAGQARKLRRRGLRTVTLTLRVAVTAQSGGATHVFKHRVLVKL